MRSHPTCKHPDRDVPSLVCGYPLPCPHHTATIDLGDKPPSVRIPVESKAALRGHQKVLQVAAILGTEDSE